MGIDYYGYWCRHRSESTNIRKSWWWLWVLQRCKDFPKTEVGFGSGGGSGGAVVKIQFSTGIQAAARRRAALLERIHCRLQHLQP